MRRHGYREHELKKIRIMRRRGYREHELKKIRRGEECLSGDCHRI
jgi:hypothetical protein